MSIPANTPEGYQLKTNLLFGHRKSHPGLFEIKIHNPKMRNALTSDTMLEIANLINSVQNDSSVKVILLHGGKYYSSGNDLTSFRQMVTGNKEDIIKLTEHSLKVKMAGWCMAMAKSVKPVICVVRGSALGIAFTNMAHATFIYASPEATWGTPFI